MIRSLLFSMCLLFLAACSESKPDQASIDAAVETALNERDREDAAKFRASERGDADESAEPVKPGSATAGTPEKLRDDLPTGLGSPYGMCIRTLSIVGEQCGCMVNRAADAGLGGPALTGMFGGDGKRATPAQIDTFKRIVRACANYNITIEGSSAAQSLAQSDAGSTAVPAKAAAGERMARCEFVTTRDNYNGPCRFLPGKGGDFRAISTKGAFSEGDGVYRIDLDVTGTNVGSLVIDHGFEPYVIAVTRSQTDRACWEGGEATFCAR